MMNDGYPRLARLRPEGKIPPARGQEEPNKFTTLWRTLPAGVDTKKPLADFYPPDVLDALRGQPRHLPPLGDHAGPGRAGGATLGELPVPRRSPR